MRTDNVCEIHFMHAKLQALVGINLEINDKLRRKEEQ